MEAKQTRDKPLGPSSNAPNGSNVLNDSSSNGAPGSSPGTLGPGVRLPVILGTTLGVIAIITDIVCTHIRVQETYEIQNSSTRER